MKKLLLFLALSLWPLLGAAQTTPVAIVGATLIDGTGRPAVANAVVVFREGRILWAGPRRRAQIPQGAQIIEGQGLVIAPGFIDTHNHSQSGLESRSCATALSRVRNRARFCAINLRWGASVPRASLAAK